MLFLALTTLSTSNAATPLYVNGADGNDTWDGTTPTYTTGIIGPMKTIQTAIGAVDNGGTVNVANGTYKEHLTISKNVNLVGESQEGTIIDGNNTGRPVTINSGTVNITNFTIQNGNVTTGDYESSSGGGIYNGWGTVTVTQCTIQNNVIKTGEYGSNYGGGIYNGWGTMTVTQSTIQNNTLTNSTGVSNYGGGIYNSRGTVTVTQSTIQNNTLTTGDSGVNYGGGIYNAFGTVTVTQSTIQNNSLTTGDYGFIDGGGIYNFNGNVIVNQSTIQNNILSAGDFGNSRGGGIFNAFGTVTANFNRIVNNSQTTIFHFLGTFDAQYNWWGSNNPNFTNLIGGTVDYTPWLYMTITADPTIINNEETSLITASFNNLFNGTTVTPLDPLTGHIPDGSPVTFATDLGSIGSKTIDKETTGGIATAKLTADETAGIAHITATTDAQTVNTEVTINPKSSLYLTITPNKANPVVGDTVIYTLKVGNNGPDTANDVVMTYVVPEGLEFAGASVDKGTYTYNPTTRTITWNIGNVPVGDPYMWLSLKVLSSGSYLFNPTLSTSTYDPTLNTNTQSITIHAASATNNNTNNTVNAATSTVSMQHTGIPLIALILALFMVIGGMISSKK